MIVDALLFELQLFELEYTCYMFDDVVWGNREVFSKVQSTKLEIKCTSDPKNKVWARPSTPPKYKRTYRLIFIKMFPFLFRMLFGLLIWFKVFTISFTINAIITLAFLNNYFFAFGELLCAPKMRQQRSYKPGSSLKLPGPILEHVDLDKCEKV